MRPVNIDALGWRGVSGTRAESFWDRLIGVKSRSAGEALLIRTRSVHTFGVGRSLNVVGIGDDLSVVGSKHLKPNRMAHFPKARFVMELPESIRPPEIGSQVRIRDV